MLCGLVCDEISCGAQVELRSVMMCCAAMCCNVLI